LAHCILDCLFAGCCAGAFLDFSNAEALKGMTCWFTRFSRALMDLKVLEIAQEEIGKLKSKNKKQ
jgi:hypothetical protein